MMRPVNETEDFLLSVPKVCEKPFKQTQQKTEETQDFETIKQKRNFFI